MVSCAAIGTMFRINPWLSTAHPLLLRLTSLPPPAVAPVQAAPLLATGISAPGDPVGPSDPLSPPPTPLTQAESLVEVTYIYPQPALGTMPPLPADPPPDVAPVEVAPLLITGILTPGGPAECSDPCHPRMLLSSKMKA